MASANDAKGVATSSFYHPEIDVLRFGAFLFVYLYHAMPQQPAVYLHLGLTRVVAAIAVGFLHGSAYGVDLFFALSSYLITELLLREYRSRRDIDIKAFYARRILRIWPLYFTALFAGSMLLRAMNQEVLGRGYLLSFAFFAGNWACVAWGLPSSGLAPLWSVSIEEQFYLAWPFVIKYCIRHLRLMAAGLIVCAFVARAVSLATGITRPGFVWCDTFARLDPIAGGALLAVILDGRVPRFQLRTRVAMLTGAVAIFALVGAYCDYTGPSTLIGYPAATVASILMIAGTLAPMSPAPPRGIVRVPVALGRISYGLYVYHLAAIRLIQAPSSSALRWVINILGPLGLTILLATASYRWLESPFLKLKKRFSYVQSTPALPNLRTLAVVGANIR